MTKELTGNEIKSTINDKFHELIISIENDHLLIKNDNEKLLDFFNSLKKDNKYNLLSSVTSVDYMSKFVVVYHLTSI